MKSSIRRPSYKILPEDVPLIKQRHLKGEFQNRIAADYDVNPGRINEIIKGKKFKDVPPLLPLMGVSETT